jgi:surface protein
MDEFNQNLNSWDVSNVTKMTSMFNSSQAFNGNISNWDTSKVTLMVGMFYNAPVFNQDITNWNTSSVASMQRMFFNAVLFNQDIGNWNTSNVNNMTSMFQGATAFNQDLSGWCVPNLSEPTDFKTSANATWINDSDKQPDWGECPAPQVTLTDSDADNYVLNSSVVTITATFSAAMSPTVNISIGNNSFSNNGFMTQVSSSTFTYVWSLANNGGLPDGDYFATVSGEDINGRAFVGTDSITFTILSPPSTPTSAPDLDPNSDAGSSNSDNLTNVTTPTFTGTVSPNSGIVYLYAEKDGGSPSIVASATTANDGSYTISPTAALTSGSYVFYVKVENAAGDTSGNSPPVNTTIQTTPQAPNIPSLKAESDLGISNSDNVTSDDTPSITGTISPTTAFKVYVDGTLFDTFTSDLNGEFEVDFTTSLRI